MNHPALDLYAGAFVARHSRGSAQTHRSLSEPGLYGVVPAVTEQAIRLLVIDDRGYGPVAQLAAGRVGIVEVFAGATRCEEFLRREAGWRADPPTTAMALRDLHAVAGVALPDGLALRPVARSAADAADGVPLLDAAVVTVASDPRLAESPTEFAEFLRSLPPSVRLLAAVDEGGVARATSGYDLFGDCARVFLVNTQPAWRRRGIGRAMTVAALQAAASSGARRAVLDASDAGASVYRALAFETAGRLTRYRRP